MSQDDYGSEDDEDESEEDDLDPTKDKNFNAVEVNQQSQL